MEIIKRGKLPDKSHTEKCANCQTVFKYVASDVKSCYDSRDDYTEYWVECPLPGCKHQITVNN
jgi:hypothetical protein